jgi:hypothetical protein
MQGKIALTVLAGLYLFAVLFPYLVVLVLGITGWGDVFGSSPPPFPFYLFMIPGFLFQAGLVGVALWLLWREPKPPGAPPPPWYRV